MPHVRLFILLALHTAGRPSSILDLTWDRVHFRDGKILLDNPDRDRTSKGRATVPIAEPLIEPLREAHVAAQTGYVIEWAGKRVGSVKKGIREAARRAGIKGVTPYVLRHTAAVWMAEGGVPMSEISQYLGHTSTAVTERVYARYSPDYLRRASEAISRRLG
jgi:integrase